MLRRSPSHPPSQANCLQVNDAVGQLQLRFLDNAEGGPAGGSSSSRSSRGGTEPALPDVTLAIGSLRAYEQVLYKLN